MVLRFWRSFWRFESVDVFTGGRSTLLSAGPGRGPTSPTRPVAAQCWSRWRTSSCSRGPARSTTPGPTPAAPVRSAWAARWLCHLVRPCDCSRRLMTNVAPLYSRRRLTKQIYCVSVCFGSVANSSSLRPGGLVRIQALVVWSLSKPW
jgi:hypothetical protein